MRSPCETTDSTHDHKGKNFKVGVNWRNRHRGFHVSAVINGHDTGHGTGKGVKAMGTKTYAGYLRISTRGQQQSGLGLEAQRATISAHINGKVAAEFVECESGRRNDRPELKRALAFCRRSGAVLVIAKMDRLSRNARFLLALIDADVELEFCDLPQCSGPAGRMMLTMMAGFSEMEAGLISERTKAALAACRARGVRLGNPDGGRALTAHIRTHGNTAGMVGNVKAASRRAAPWRETIESLISQGLTAYAIAKALTARGEKTARGSVWTTCAVARLIRRLEIPVAA